MVGARTCLQEIFSGLGTVGLRKRQEVELEDAEMWRFPHGGDVTWIGK